MPGGFAHADPSWGESTPSLRRTAPRAGESSPVDLAFLGGLWFYRNAISPLDGTRCGMYPTCSAYATQAIRAHGFLLGGMLAADRLMHESGARPPDYPLIRKFGRERVYDPVEANDRWLGGKAGPAPAVRPKSPLFGHTPELLPAAGVEPDAEATREAAEALARDGRPFAAVTEYRRAAFLYPNRTDAARALLEAASVAADDARREHDDDRVLAAWEEADRLFDESARDAEEGGESAAARQAETLRALAILVRGYPREAQHRFQALQAAAPQDAVATDEFLAAWAGMEAQLEDGIPVSHAVRELAAVPGPQAQQAVVALAGEDISWRSPAVAGGLSAVLPGAGFVYAGRPLIGAGSFLLNGVFLAGIYFAARDHNLPLAGALLSVEVGWYLGGISGSAEEAARHGDESRRRFAARNRRRFLGAIVPGGVSGGWLF